MTHDCWGYYSERREPRSYYVSASQGRVDLAQPENVAEW